MRVWLIQDPSQRARGLTGRPRHVSCEGPAPFLLSSQNIISWLRPGQSLEGQRTPRPLAWRCPHLSIGPSGAILLWKKGWGLGEVREGMGVGEGE